MTPAKKLAEEHPYFKFLLVDHRGHGDSSACTHTEDTIEACAADVGATVREAVGSGEGVVSTVIGHSFGGKVALAFALQQRETPFTWLVDSVPGCKPEGTVENGPSTVDGVLEALEFVSQSGPFLNRQSCIALLEEKGLDSMTAAWLCSSLRKSVTRAGGVEFTYDIDTVRRLYDAYGRTDLWAGADTLAQTGKLGIIVASRNMKAWRGSDEMLLQLGPSVVTTLEAGHNVHVDNLPGMLRVMDPTLSRYR